MLQIDDEKEQELDSFQAYIKHAALDRATPSFLGLLVGGLASAQGAKMFRILPASYKKPFFSLWNGYPCPQGIRGVSRVKQQQD